MIDFEAVDQITWDRLRVASGQASEVGESLKGLVSPDKETRERSYWRLDNEIVCQSDLYEAAYFATPILIGFLDEAEGESRLLIYDLLYEIANGYAPHDETVHTSKHGEQPLQNACMFEVHAGLQKFQRDAQSKDESLKSRAVDLLDLLAEYKPPASFPPHSDSGN